MRDVEVSISIKHITVPSSTLYQDGRQCCVGQELDVSLQRMSLQREIIFFLRLTPACRLTSGQAVRENGAEQDADYRAVDVALESAEGKKKRLLP